jgi:bacterial/archaeal transporter family-2 protein
LAVAERRRATLPTLAAVAGGAGLAVQSYINGRLAGAIGSAELAAVSNFVIGLALLLAVVLATGAARRALPRLRRLQPWHVLGGLGGALFVTAGTLGAPKLGVALLSVAVVSGLTSGSLLADRLGLSPAGRQHATAARMAGAALAVGAVLVSAFGARAHLDLALLALAVVAGFGSSLQQAANGHVARETGEPLIAATINFAVGLVAVLVVALVATGVSPPHGWAAPPLEYTGGVLGVAIATTLAVVVSRLGVLRLMLGVTAGQVAGGLAVDLVAPVAREPVTAGTVAGVALACAAVLVSGRERKAARPAS